MNYNQNNNCNNLGTCSECKNKYWLGELIQLDNWHEKGILCRDCLLKIEIPCRRCSRFFSKIEQFSDWEKGNYQQHEKVDRKKWEKEKPDEKCWPYIGCEYYIHGGQFCSKKECKGHFVPEHGHFCSRDCREEWNGGVNRDGAKYKEWKTAAEKLGWTPCQEKDLFRDWDNHSKLSTYKEKIRKEKGEQALACDGMAAPGEKYCQYCESDRKVWDLNNEKNWGHNYRKYWNITNDRNDSSESSSLVSSSSSSNDNETEKLEKELIETKRQGKSQAEIEKLKSKLERLNNQQKGGNEPVKDNHGLIFGGVLFFGSALVLGAYLVIKKKKN